MSERLKFLGFPDAWKRGQDAQITGFGSVPEGATVDVPDDLASFLLTSERWERSDEELTPRQPESLPTPPDTGDDSRAGDTTTEGAR